MPELSNMSLLNADDLKIANAKEPMYITTYTIFDRVKTTGRQSALNIYISLFK